jgi:lipopolysaccharide biosynthesis glycosyltransferase
MPGLTPHHVVVATDENFAMPTAVTLRSLVQNGGGPFAISVIHDGLTTDARDRITASIDNGEGTLEWLDVSDFDVRPTTASHLPDSTYYRLRLADALPDDVARAVYLDVDVLVCRDISPLWEEDLGNNTIGAVQSVHFPFIGSLGAIRDWRILGLDPRGAFFNAGVLAVDVARWRSEAVADATLDYLRSPHCGHGADQEALNAVAAGHWHPFAPALNQQTPLLDDGYGAHLIHSDDEIDTARTDPAIIHFQTRPKPWHRDCPHPWKNAWTAVARQTAFDNIVDLRQRTPRDELRRRTRRAASALVRGT